MKRQRKSGSARRERGGVFKRTKTKDPRYAKGVRFFPDGSRKVLLSDHQVELIEAQRARFVEKFGREPSGSDPVFFDPTADEPKPLAIETQALLEHMLVAGIRPMIAYASAKTGVFLTEENEHLYPDDAKDAFQEACLEYLRDPGVLRAEPRKVSAGEASFASLVRPEKLEGKTFERLEGFPWLCAICGEREDDHLWICGACEIVLGMGDDELPAKLCEDCKGSGAWLVCCPPFRALS